MKKFTKLMSLTAALCVMLSSVPYSTSAYNYQGDFTLNEILDSEIKPKITVDSECISIDEAQANPTRTISISVDGADLKYSSAAFHIYYDSRLNISLNDFGSPKITSGPAWESLTTSTPLADPTAATQGMRGIFICSESSTDSGHDGVMCTIELQLPSDVASGDVFPIDIIYKSMPVAEDLFTNAKNNETGQLMQAYAFTYGIYNGVTSMFTPKNEDVSKCNNLINIDPSYDGYIAIENAAATTQPTTTNTVGDANGDGNVNMSDATAIIQHIGNKDRYGLKGTSLTNADTNGDGLVTTADAIIIQELLAGMHKAEDLPLKTS